MSLVDVWMTSQKAMVVVDTECKGVVDQSQYIEASKMLTLPHANVVLAIRGHDLFAHALITSLRLAPAFDEIEDEMPAALKYVTHALQNMPGPHIDDLHKQEVTVVGYSRIRGRMCCLVYQSRDETGFDFQEISDLYLSPWDASWGQEGIHAQTTEHARIIASEQVSRALELHPDAPFGGRLLLAEVTRDDCRLSTLARVTSRA